ncbi:MAG TPA: copper homeostasis protein CutC [Edaphobacter sp.]|nr:copper homeostasis protein CutC [Edaphobacter sp.]
MSSTITFELCAETLQACRAAREGGANRIELCSALSEDGLTPSHALIREAVKLSGLPVYILLRPRAGGFVYSEEEFALMREDLLHARSLGAQGFAIGALHADATVDIERTRELVELAFPLEVTFHRAFDLTPAVDQALEDVIATGCRRVLTSGGKNDVVAGAANLAELVERSRGRIDVAAGGGLRLGNAAEVAKITRASHFHGSVRRRSDRVAAQREDVLASAILSDFFVDPDDVRAILRSLRAAGEDAANTG